MSQSYTCRPLLAISCNPLQVTHFNTIAFSWELLIRSFLSCCGAPTFKDMQLQHVSGDSEKEKKNSSHAQQTFPGCVKGTLTSAAVHPTPPQQSLLSIAQSSCRFHVSDLCCCCFLLWAEFYTVCQSPERHTLEGPVEWDTKSDPSGEQLFSHLPPQPLCVCLSLSPSSSLSLTPFLSLLFFLLLLLYFFNNSPDSWPSLRASDPLCLERLRYICWRVQRSSGRPSPANIPPACITASVQTNEHDWGGNVPTAPSLCPFFFVW